MKIYTKTGDKGQTSLYDGSRVSKSSSFTHALGALDELNAQLGLVQDLLNQQDISIDLLPYQKEIFTLGSYVATVKDDFIDRLPTLKTDLIDQMESDIDAYTLQLPKMTHFIMPGGHPTVSQIHIARTLARRAERWIVDLPHESCKPCIPFLNRLSDYLFTLARFTAKELKVEEVKWIP